jgi:hypothetical protein
MPQPERDRRPTDYRAYLDAYARAWQRFQDRPSEENVRVLLAGEEILMRELLLKPGNFELGQLVSTPGAIEAMELAGHIPPEFLLRHKHGDWGELPPEDIAENERAVHEGSRIFSAYRTRREEKLWVITEWDRSVTTLLLPEEY